MVAQTLCTVGLTLEIEKKYDVLKHSSGNLPSDRSLNIDDLSIVDE